MFASLRGRERRDGWMTGILGRIITFIVVGLVAGVMRQSIMGFVVGIAAGLGVFVAPDIIDNIVTAIPIPADGRARASRLPPR
jgi:hypothetical protein